MDPIKEKIILQLQKQPEPISSTRLAEHDQESHQGDQSGTAQFSPGNGERVHLK